MPLLSQGRQWSRHALEWSALQLTRAERATSQLGWTGSAGPSAGPSSARPSGVTPGSARPGNAWYGNAWSGLTRFGNERTGRTPAAGPRRGTAQQAVSHPLACARRGCERSSSDYPHGALFYEGRDVCSRDCLLSLIAAEVRDVFQPRTVADEPYSHRLPMGLLMLSRKWITPEQLSLALARQRSAGAGRIGEWLVATGAVDEGTVARALAAQWGIPVLFTREQAADAAGLVPTLLTDFFGALPVRIAANRILYLAVEQQVHPSLNLAIEKMTGLRVEPVVLPTSVHRSLWESARGAAAMAAPAAMHGPAAARRGPEAPSNRFFRSHSPKHLCASILSLVEESETRNIQVAVLGSYVWLRLLRGEVETAGPRTEEIVFSCRSDHPVAGAVLSG